MTQDLFDQSRPRRLRAAMLVVLGLALLCGVYLVWKAIVGSAYVGLLAHLGLAPSYMVVANLDSPDTDVQRESLSVLLDSHDPGGLNKAAGLLTSSDDYVWLNAALYRGAFAKPDAVPYLIKALGHTAFRCDPDAVRDLQTITGQTFGDDFTAWQNWWIGANPATTVDFESHLGPIPRLPAPTTSK